MNQKTTHVRRAAATVSVAIALIAPTVAHASCGGGAPPTGVARQAAAASQALATECPGSAGLDRRDAAVAAAIVVGVVLMGLWGHVVVGAVIAAVAALLGAGARLATSKPRGGRGWTDWSHSAAVPVESPKSQHSTPSRVAGITTTDVN
jgi:hypothetical protein